MAVLTHGPNGGSCPGANKYRSPTSIVNSCHKSPSALPCPGAHTAIKTALGVHWKEMFYITTHSTYFILRFYGVVHMVKDHSDSERGNPLPPHGLLFPIGCALCICVVVV